MANMEDAKKPENEELENEELKIEELEKVSGGENIVKSIDDDWGEELPNPNLQQPKAP